MLTRTLGPLLRKRCNENKIVVLRGAKRTGRMTLLSQIFNLDDEAVGVLNCESKKERKKYEQFSDLQQFCSGKCVLIIREAQLLASLQVFIDWVIEQDAIENLILVCSFEPDLHEELWEALREQELELNLLPVSYEESAQAFGLVQEDAQLEQRLIYGYYPEVVANPERAEGILYQILETSTFTQLGASDRINKREKLIKLMRHLAFNIGQVISFNDLGKKCGLDNETVERYVKLFAKANVLILMPSYNNGHRYELKKSHVVYFLDNGIRNALIRAFQPLEFRNDTAELWRNWVISERFKANQYAGRVKERYFWLTHTKQEVDYLEFSEGQKNGYKLIWEDSRKFKVPATFSDAYPDIKVSVVNRKTFWNFLRMK